ncbi:MAG: hypothetical protein M3458_15065 [Acidobacteriota bacterium]|nr:hypothetical protein [Acidobacteriota bacterium]
MAAKAKNGNGNGSNGNGPALHFEFIERRESDTYMMDVRVLEMLDMYPQYIESLAGKRPTKDQVVEKALEKVLSSDAGFQKYLATGNSKAIPKQKVGAGNEPAEAVGSRQKTVAQAG